MLQKSISDWWYMKISYSGYLDLHLNGQKHDFCHFPLTRFFLASRRIRKLKYDAGKYSDAAVMLNVINFIKTMELLRVQGLISSI
jgi:nucleoside-specific outer membrane channel protein Tsx